MDILLTHGYFLADDDEGQTMMKPYPHLGLLYLAAYLKQSGFAVDIFDSTFQTMTDFVAYLQQQRPNVVGLYSSVMTHVAILNMIQICHAMGVKVVLGGPETALYAAEYLHYGVDVVVVGEGELTLTELLPYLSRGQEHQLHAVAGIVFLDEDGKAIHTPPRPLIEDINPLPWPDRAGISMQPYFDTWRTHHGMSSVSLITTRSTPDGSHETIRHRQRTPQAVADEVEAIAMQYDPDQLWYADDVLTRDPVWFLEYSAEIKRRGLRHPFECSTRADHLDEQVVDALANLGCYRLWMGGDSTSERLLDRMKHQTVLAEVQQKTKLLQNRGIKVGMFIQLGYQMENMTDLQTSIEHLKETNPDFFVTTIAYQTLKEQFNSYQPEKQPSSTELLPSIPYNSRQFYNHTTRWMVNELHYYKLRQLKSRNLWQLTKTYLNAKRGKMGMYITKKSRPLGDSDPQATEAWLKPDKLNNSCNSS